MDECREELRLQGKPYPRTCPKCGIKPCQRTTIERVKKLEARIAELEAERAERERERQEPVAWSWNDALGCMHAHCGSRRPVWIDGECSDAKRAETSLRPLYAAPPVPRVDPEWLSNAIRRIAPHLCADRDELAKQIADSINGRNL